MRGLIVVLMVAAAGCSSDATGVDAPHGLADALVGDASLVDSSPPADSCAVCPATPVFVGSWGGYGMLPGQFVEPSSVELLSSGIVIVAGHENRVQRFTGAGVLIDIFGVAGAGDGEFNHPHGLAVDRARGDLLYVGDQENHRLQVFSPTGEFVRRWGDAQFAHIHDVGIDGASGNIFVGDYELDTLRKFSPTGELLATYGGTGVGPGQFNGVWGISTDSAGNVYVADTFNRRVQKFDVNGTFLAEWKTYGGVSFMKPTGVFVDSNDVVYVCDSLAQVVALFDTAGQFLQLWDLQQIYGRRSEPEDIVIDAERKHIYIAEVFEHRVLHLVSD